MKLQRFKVANFRSVIDSGWITVDDVTTLVGINESGKSNILLALWKLICNDPCQAPNWT